MLSAGRTRCWHCGVAWAPRGIRERLPRLRRRAEPERHGMLVVDMLWGSAVSPGVLLVQRFRRS